MDKDRIRGMGNEAKGEIKKTAGEALGDTKLKGEGQADKLKGKIQNTVGGVKDAIREANDKANDDE